jgi:hypothetical protein
LGDPLPVGTGCESGSAATDAEAVARTVRSDPDLTAAALVVVSVGGTEALGMDVRAAPGASVCETYPGTQVLTPDERWFLAGACTGAGKPDAPLPARRGVVESGPGHRDHCSGGALRVVEAATPVVDSIEFRMG